MHNVTGITTAHAILVRGQPDGSVGIKFKAWHSSTELWQGDSHHPSEWLHVLHSFPSGHPPSIAPSLLDIEASLASVSKILPSDTSQEIHNKWIFFFRDNILHTQHYERLPDNFWNFSQVCFLIFFKKYNNLFKLNNSFNLRPIILISIILRSFCK